jgi:hypothetical protein
MTSETADNGTEVVGKLLPFDATRRPNHVEPRVRFATRVPDHEAGDGEKHVVAVVTVSRFIGNEKVHAQVPVFAEQIQGDEMSAADLKFPVELSELLADGAVEANSYLDRLTATRAARPLRDYCAAMNS